MDMVRFLRHHPLIPVCGLCQRAELQKSRLEKCYIWSELSVVNSLGISVCELPNLTESIELHRVFLRSLLEHWNDIHGTNVKRLLIT